MKRHNRSYPAKEWSEKEKAFLRKNVYKKTYAFIASVLNRTPKAIERMAAYLDLSRPERSHAWNKDETTFLLKNYRRLSNVDIARAIGRKPQGVGQKKKKLGITKRRTSS